MEDPLSMIEEIADWSPWVPFEEALATAPLVPGVYMAREGTEGPVVYVGMAGERAGGGRPKGLRGRLSVYVSGKGVVSGLGEAAMDRALADAEWLRERLAEVERGTPKRAKEWGQAAMARAKLQVRWATTADKATANALEQRVLRALRDTGLWNRGRVMVFKMPT